MPMALPVAQSQRGVVMPSQEPFDAGQRVDGPSPPTGGAVEAAELYRRTVEYGFDRAREALRRHGLAAALLFDPLNIRYVTGSSLMPVWTLHVLDRFVLLPVDGKPVLWEYPAATAGLAPQIDVSVRPTRSWSVFDNGVPIDGANRAGPEAPPRRTGHRRGRRRCPRACHRCYRQPRICPARGASGSEGWAIIRAAPSAKRRASGAASQRSLRDGGRADCARQR